MRLYATLTWIGRHGGLLLPLGLVIGIMVPPLSHLARPLAEPLVVILFTTSIYRLDPRAILRQLRYPVALICGIAWILLLIPFLVYAIGTLVELPPGLLAVTVTWSACPPLVSIPGLALLFGLNGAVALVVLIGAALVFTVSLPLLLSFLLADFLPFETITLLFRLLTLVSFCLIAGQGLRCLVGHHQAERHSRFADGVLVVLLSLFAISIMGGFHTAMATTPDRIPLFIAATFVASIGLQIMTVPLFHLFKRRTGGAIALAAGNRNISIMLPVAGDSLGNDLVLFLAVIQFPIYLLPLIVGPAYRRYCRQEPP